MMDNAAPHLWVVQVPNINGTSSGRLPQVHRSIGPLRQKQLGQTSNMDVVVIIKVAPPPVIVIIERCLLIFSPQHCIPRMKERKKNYNLCDCRKVSNSALILQAKDTRE